MAQGMKRDAALTITGVTRHQFYYRHCSGKAGRPVGHATPRVQEDGTTVPVPDALVEEEICALKAEPATDCGYQKTARLLMLMGWYIGPKKTARLMREAHVMGARHTAPQRTYVKDRSPLSAACRCWKRASGACVVLPKNWTVS